MFNGTKKGIVTVAQRKAVDIEALYISHFPENHKREVSLLEAGAKWEDEMIKSVRGLNLSTRTLIPKPGMETNCGIIFCHGYGDHLRWINKGTFLTYCERGYLITGLELEGHGYSDSTVGYLPDLGKAVDDLHSFIIRQQQKHKKDKWIIHGQSMGGAVALLESLKSNEKKNIQLDGLVLIAPMCKISEEVQPPKAAVNCLLLMAKCCPKLSIVPSSFDNKLAYKDPKVYELVSKDPIQYEGKPRMATAATMYRSTKRLEGEMSELTTPFILLHGKKDIVTSHKASEELFEKTVKIAKEDKVLHLFEDCWHGTVYGEPEEDVKKYWGLIFDWIAARAAVKTA